jgi:hypothetical protein
MARLSRKAWLLAAAVALLIVLAAVLIPAIRSARLAAQRQERLNHMKQIGMGLHNFHDTYRRLPAAVRRDEAGRSLCSWRFQILPFLESMMLGIDFSDRWDDPANRCLSARPYWVYCRRPDAPYPESVHTNIVAVTGPGTAFDEDRAIRLSDLPEDLILALEVARSDTHWMEPGDLAIDDLPARLTQGLDGGGLCVLFADGSVWFLSVEVPIDELTKFLTIEGAGQFSREEILAPFGH